MNYTVKPNLNNLENALSALKRAVDVYERSKEEDKEVIAMAVIQGFEVAMEMSWKAMRKTLFWLGSLNVSSHETKSELFRMAMENAIIDDAGKWLEYYRNRNMTSHNYGFEVADTALEYAFRAMEDFEKLVKNLQRILNDQ